VSVYPRLVLKCTYSVFFHILRFIIIATVLHPNLSLTLCPSSGMLHLFQFQQNNSRMKLFNTLLSEVMFKQNEDMMDIEDILSRMNDSSSVHISNKSFTLLEIKPYLQSLHDSGHIFLVEDEGRHGVVYAI